MTSIRVKLTLGAALLFAGGIGILLAANALFMEPYYAARTRAAFAELAAKMASAGPDPAAEIKLAKAVSAGTGYKIVVADREGQVRASSVPEFQEGQSFPLPKEQLEFFLGRRDRIAAGASFFGAPEPNPMGQSVIQLMTGLSGGRVLVITQPLEELRRNIAAASPFFLAVGSLVLVLALAAALAYATRMSRPILELSEVARRVAAADYGARFSRRRDDELGALGDSLNAMAETLSRNIEELAAANRELARKVKAQEDFIAGASHELKTPVGLVRGYAEAIQLGLYSSDAERDELADVILKEADHLDRLVGDLASIAASSGAARILALEDEDLSGLLAGAIDRFALEAREKGVSIHLESGGPLVARLDHHRIVQVVDNLLSNAVRRTREGGRITVRAYAADRSARVEVENSAEPIPEEHLRGLFEPFYRADSSRSRDSGGTGLGLAVVKGIMSAHGGRCGVRNAPGGPLFWFSLPRGGAA
jgi:two-component system, OmpR family, sensor histidine kinase VanS